MEIKDWFQKKVQTIYIYTIDTTTDHITPCCACARGVIKEKNQGDTGLGVKM